MHHPQPPRVTQEAPLIDFSSPQQAAAQPASLAPSIANFKDDDAADLANWIGEENMEKPETSQVRQAHPSSRCFYL